MDVDRINHQYKVRRIGIVVRQTYHYIYSNQKRILASFPQSSPFVLDEVDNGGEDIRGGIIVTDTNSTLYSLQ